MERNQSRITESYDLFCVTLIQELSPELKERVNEVFRIFDKDDSKTIEKEEAVKHWSKNFGKISA